MFLLPYHETMRCLSAYYIVGCNVDMQIGKEKTYRDVKGVDVKSIGRGTWCMGSWMMDCAMGRFILLAARDSTVTRSMLRDLAY